MKDIHKNPIIYYIAVPVIVAIWPILVRGIYIPAAQEKLDNDMSDYIKGNDIMIEILSLAPERSDPIDPNQEEIEFTYYRVVNEIASLCNIPSSKYKYDSGTLSDTRNKSKTQTADVRFTSVDITSFAKFLSTIQARWPKLVCNSIKIEKKQGLPDQWDVTIDFKYYYTNLD